MNISILLAAGSSTRAGQDKLWADVFGRPLWTLAFETFKSHPQIDRVILVVRPGKARKSMGKACILMIQSLIYKYNL